MIYVNAQGIYLCLIDRMNMKKGSSLHEETPFEML